GLVKRHATEEAVARANAVRILQLDPAAMHIYTDGAVCVQSNAAAGGFAVVDGGRCVAQIGDAYGGNACSYSAELRTICMALEWLHYERVAAVAQVVPGKVAIVTDSRSSVLALAKGPLAQSQPLEQRAWLSLALLA